MRGLSYLEIIDTAMLLIPQEVSERVEDRSRAVLYLGSVVSSYHGTRHNKECLAFLLLLELVRPPPLPGLYSFFVSSGCLLLYHLGGGGRGATSQSSAGIFQQCIGARHRVGIGLPARQAT